MSMSCSDSAFIFICNVVNKDFVPKMKEVRDNTKSLSYVAEKQLEMIEGD